MHSRPIAAMLQSQTAKIGNAVIRNTRTSRPVKPIRALGAAMGMGQIASVVAMAMQSVDTTLLVLKRYLVAMAVRLELLPSLPVPALLKNSKAHQFVARRQAIATNALGLILNRVPELIKAVATMKACAISLPTIIKMVVKVLAANGLQPSGIILRICQLSRFAQP
jgi:hypothetical protein